MSIIRRIGKITGILFTAFLCIILVANVYTAVVRETTGEPQPDFFGWSWAVVVSGSMEPDIMVDDMVVIHEKSDYFVGEDIAFVSGDKVITHRIIEKYDTYYVTQGIANNTEDDPIYPEDVIGKVVLVIPGVASMIEFFRTPIGLILLLLICAIAIELPQIVDFIKKKLSRDPTENADSENEIEKITRIDHTYQSELSIYQKKLVMNISSPMKMRIPPPSIPALPASAVPARLPI